MLDFYIEVNAKGYCDMKKENIIDSKENSNLAIVTKNGSTVYYDNAMYRYIGHRDFYVSAEGKAIRVLPLKLFRDLYFPNRYEGEHNARKLAAKLFKNQQGCDHDGTQKTRFNRS